MAEPTNTRLTFLGQLLVFIFIVGCGYGAYVLFTKKNAAPASGVSASPGESRSTSGGGETPSVEIGIAIGTEKQRWLEWAVQQFSGSKEGAKIGVKLIPMGSLEAAQAILRGDERIHVWSPASSLYEDVFLREWQLKYNKSPVVRKEALALSPMVFVMWAERYDAFVSKYRGVSFQTIGQALGEVAGWDAIAQKPEWGLFKFGHTHPNQSNSGLMTLVLMAQDYHKKSRGLSMKDVLDPAFQTWMNGIERATTGMSNSTGNMMRDMVLRGPSSYDALFVYESVVIDYLKSAEGRWGELRVAYPPQNMWNDNPYYVLDATWSNPAQRKAADAFLTFLLSEPIQRESLKHGFRPGNPTVPIRFAESPFVQYERFGLKIDLGTVGESPKAEVIENLLASWQRQQGGR
jgi:Ca-activated chloride channel family protein